MSDKRKIETVINLSVSQFCVLEIFENFRIWEQDSIFVENKFQKCRKLKVVWFDTLFSKAPEKH